ncbi:MAG: alanine--tRNA ligase [Endomicrobium sp.]|nr:alanine--tRNA ligase [Endomicrobium sp.]
MRKQSLDIRNEFLSFFHSNGCDVIQSSNLVPKDDDSLLFTAAGMVQFKDFFLSKRNENLPFTKATSCQKCFRMSDIEQIGETARHLTFFEMLGNFSFGDYFKDEAIKWAWEFLTKIMHLSEENFFITVYENDNETIKIWTKILKNENKIIRMGKDTNFWVMGNKGPCGPCSEILIDLGEKVGCRKSYCNINCNCGRYLEIWNLVFTQFNKHNDNLMTNLPKKNIDTGMGLERIVAIMNGKNNVFDTDLFEPIIAKTKEILNIKITEKHKYIKQLRIIADHIRAIVFLISDGILPSNEGRGYILRKILRRALRQGQICGHKTSFLSKLVDVVINIMTVAYPDISLKRNYIQSIVETEEENFIETLIKGSKTVENIISYCKTRNLNIIPGKEIFKLYDTYGVPYDLVSEIANDNGIILDKKGFEYEKQIAKSKIGSFNLVNSNNKFYSKIKFNKQLDKTIFDGYNKHVSKGKVLLILRNGIKVNELKMGDYGNIILSKTTFYAQSGGQNSDIGKLLNDTFECVVSDVEFFEEWFIHKVKVIKGKIKIQDNVSTIINTEHRMQCSRHHTATHILNKVLRNILGNSVTQMGSLITDKYFRFDFTSLKKINYVDLIKIEKEINFKIKENLEIRTKIMKLNEAKNINAISLSNKEYNNTVRIVTIINNSNNKVYSTEFCIGTHVNKTGNIGIFKILSYSSISSGVKRIEAVAGVSAENHILKEELDILEASKLLKCSKNNFFIGLKGFFIKHENIKNELAIMKKNLIQSKLDSSILRMKKINNINFLVTLVNKFDMEMLKEMSYKLIKKLKSIVLLLVSKNVNKIIFVTSISEDYKNLGIDARTVANDFAKQINGSSGGKINFAQGGAKNFQNDIIEITNNVKPLIIKNNKKINIALVMRS